MISLISWLCYCCHLLLLFFSNEKASKCPVDILETRPCFTWVRTLSVLSFIVFVSLSNSSVHISWGLCAWPPRAEETEELMLTQLLPAVYKQQLIQHFSSRMTNSCCRTNCSLKRWGSAIVHNHINKTISAFLLSSYIISWRGMNAKSLPLQLLQESLYQLQPVKLCI